MRLKFVFVGLSTSLVLLEYGNGVLWVDVCGPYEIPGVHIVNLCRSPRAFLLAKRGSVGHLTVHLMVFC